MTDRFVPRAAFVPDMAAMAARLGEMDALPGRMLALEGALAGKASTTALTMVAQTVPALASAAPAAILQDGAAGSGLRAAREDHTHRLRFKRVKLTTNAAGQVSVTWAEPFGGVPVLNMPVVLDAAGGTYSATCLTNTAAGCSFQIRKARTLPAVIGLLSALVNFDTWVAALAGLTVWVSAAEATE